MAQGNLIVTICVNWAPLLSQGVTIAGNAIPTEGEPIVCCPDALHERLIATRVWRGANVEGRAVYYGCIPLHHHNGEECAYSGLAGRVEGKGG